MLTSTKIKIYPKTFENVFSEDHVRKFDFSKISIKEMSVDGYSILFRNLLKDFSDNLFLFYVKFVWLRRRFIYNEQELESLLFTGGALAGVFSRFLRRVVGVDTFFSRDFLYPKIATYFDSFFPEFSENNPFENPELYKFPFKNITLDFLAVVHQVEDRIELLNIADEQKMTYANFLDFVINQTYSINEELGREKYIFMTGNGKHNYIKNTDLEMSVKKINKLKEFICQN